MYAGTVVETEEVRVLNRNSLATFPIGREVFCKTGNP